jgi:hypothetical protein
MINEGPNIKDLQLDMYESTLNELIKLKPTTRLEGNLAKMNEIGG